MQFEGSELRRVLSTTETMIDVRSADNRPTGRITAMQAMKALQLNPKYFVGVGNQRRIRYLRPFTAARVTLNAGSQTTRRPTNTEGKHFGHRKLLVEHKPIRERGDS